MTETIIAQATPSGESALGILRVSGPLALHIAGSSLGTPSPSPRMAFLRNYRDLEKKILDQVVFTFFEKGRSFTGEDVLEICYHGNPLISKMISNDLLAQGCRLAQPGEFSKRAFLNGMIDLSQAESVAAVISAANEEMLMLAQQNLRGILSERLKSIKNALLEVEASIEAYIDFPEDDLGDQKEERCRFRLEETVRELEFLIEQAARTRLLEQNVRVALVGNPNVGKSSLFNLMIGEKRALTHSDAGTTRDYLESSLKVGSQWITLVDTAGLRQTTNEIEEQGIAFTINQVEQAHLILMIIDGSDPSPTLSILEKITGMKEKKIIVVKNKCDLGAFDLNSESFQGYPLVETSCKELTGLNLLFDAISKELSEYITTSDKEVLVTERNRKLIHNSLLLIKQCLQEWKDGNDEEFVVGYLRDAREKIDLIIGKSTNEDMLDVLFQNFCIGK